MKLKNKLFKRVLLLLTGLTLFSACSFNSPFLIKKGSVGMLEKSTKLDDLKSVFKNDTVITSEYLGELRYASKEKFEIMNKEGKLLLELTPRIDSSRTVGEIRIVSDKYKTKEGISLKSTFGDIKKHYKINDIQSIWNIVIVSVDEIDAFFTIDKIYVSQEFKNRVDYKVIEADIADTAPIKFFMISWNKK